MMFAPVRMTARQAFTALGKTLKRIGGCQQPYMRDLADFFGPLENQIHSLADDFH